jgi:hypothetical protein
MDEPFILPVKGGDFVTVPYTFHMNDIVSFPFEDYSPAAHEQALKDEFDQLYEERRHPSPHGGHGPERSHLGSCQPRPGARSLLHLREEFSRRERQFSAAKKLPSQKLL